MIYIPIKLREDTARLEKSQVRSKAPVVAGHMMSTFGKTKRPGRIRPEMRLRREEGGRSKSTQGPASHVDVLFILNAMGGTGGL